MILFSSSEMMMTMTMDKKLQDDNGACAVVDGWMEACDMLPKMMDILM